MNEIKMNEFDIQRRVLSEEKKLGELCAATARYTIAMCKVRDAGDSFANHLHLYSKNESINQSASGKLTKVAHTFAGIQDYRHLLCERLDSKVVKSLSDCKELCTQTKVAVRKQSPKLRRSATTDISETDKKSLTRIQTMLDDFEQKKLTYSKRLMRDMIQSELAFHAKCVELLTDAFDNIDKIDVQKDMEIFRNCIRGVSGAADVGQSLRQCAIQPIIGQESDSEEEVSDSSDCSLSVSDSTPTTMVPREMRTDDKPQ